MNRLLSRVRVYLTRIPLLQIAQRVRVGIGGQGHLQNMPLHIATAKLNGFPLSLDGLFFCINFDSQGGVATDSTCKRLPDLLAVGRRLRLNQRICAPDQERRFLGGFCD